MHIASQLESTDILHNLAKDKKILLNIRDNDETQATPLHYAAMSKSAECARYIL